MIIRDAIGEGVICGLDHSREMLAEAGIRDDAARVEWLHSGVEAILKPANCFDVVRCDRVLMHVAEPEAALKEFHRVLKPGGRLGLADVDWGTFWISLGDARMEANVKKWLSEPIRQPCMGRNLAATARRAGFVVEQVETLPAEVAGRASVDLIFLGYCVKQRLARGLLDADDAQTLDELLEQVDKQGCLRAGLTVFLTHSRKPA